MLKNDLPQKHNGKFVSRISFEGLASRIASCAFGGPELNDLYVTSALDKFLFFCDLGAQGFSVRCFDLTAK